MCHQKRGQIGGRDSLGDCDNICEGNLVFRVIFGKFMHRWFQICAQLGSFNVFFSHHRPPKLKYCFFGGSFARLTSQSQAGTLSTQYLITCHIQLSLFFLINTFFIISSMTMTTVLQFKFLL